MGEPSTSGKAAKADAPWVEKFRPKTLEDVAAHKEIIETSMQPCCCLYSLRHCL